jgi:hypothetical protein
MEDQHFFLLKHAATLKIIGRFGLLEQELKKKFENTRLAASGISFLAGKIFRGENYRQFPYIVLDYPRLFSTKSIFAFRTMFWWGHEFSFTLHLQGEALRQYRQEILDNFDILKGNEVYYCVHNSPWHYHFGADNYRLLDGESERAGITSRSFIKLSRKIPVSAHDNLIPEGLATFSLFLKLLGESGADDVH